MLETKLITFCTEYLYELFDDERTRIPNICLHASVKLFNIQVEMTKEYLMYKTCRYGIREYTISRVTTYAGIIYCDLESDCENYYDVPLDRTELLK